MAKQLPPWSVIQLIDDYGTLLAGGTIATYAAGTSTPLDTYTEADGLTANTNPIVCSSGGRASIFLTEGLGYKFVINDVDGNLIETVDNIVAGDLPSTVADAYEINANYSGTPGAQAWMGGDQIVRSVLFPINFDGADASVKTNPAASYVVSIKRNGTEVGTCTFATSGVPTFATTGGATQAFVFGDELDFYAPDTVGTAADIKIKLVGAL
jgi:hypothetical protein